MLEGKEPKLNACVPKTLSERFAERTDRDILGSRWTLQATEKGETGLMLIGASARSVKHNMWAGPCTEPVRPVLLAVFHRSFVAPLGGCFVILLLNRIDDFWVLLTRWGYFFALLL